MNHPRLIPKIPALIYGADYNPEQWAEEVWQDDMRRMHDCGVNLVHVAIFAWAKVNPRPGVFEFAWLDRVMDLLAKNGIFAGLATATASPPAWLGKRHPESRPTDRAGQPLFHGSRQAYTPNSRAYWQHAEAVVERMAARYAAHPALAEWHVNNEFGCHVQLSFGEEDAKAFRVWLQTRDKALDALNDAWGTSFWSQTYHDWSEIDPPRQSPAFINPSMMLDYRRFFSDAYRNLFRKEKEILRRHTPDVPVTTNFIGLYPTLDQFSWAEDLDFTAWDSYPDPRDATASFGWPIGHDLTRSLKGRPFLLMEQVTSQVNWRARNHLKPPGLMRLWSLQAIARGADGVMFFQWRKSRYGAEKYHGAMVGHTPPDESREFLESRALGRDLQRLQPVCGSRVRAEAALLYDWSSRWLLEAEAGPCRFDYDAVVSHHHTALVAAGVTVDILPPDRDLSSYKLVVAPLSYLWSDQAVAQLRAFVERGGTLVLTFFSGIVEATGHVRTGGYPAALRDLLGLWVEEWEPLPENEPVALAGASGPTTGTLFSERIHLVGSEALLRYAEGLFAGAPAICRHQPGDGTCYYLSTILPHDFLAPWLKRIAEEAGVPAPLEHIPAGLEVTERASGDRRFLFLLNHTSQTMALKSERIYGTDLLSGSEVAGQMELPARGAAVVALTPDPRKGEKGELR
jgi:beta-galactosidase